MKQSITRIAQFICFSIALLIATGCATHIKVDDTRNPAPKEAFNAFTRFEVQKVTLAPAYAGQEANERAWKKIQENVDTNLGDTVSAWNKAGEGKPVRTLVVAPQITEVKFINGNARFWAGAMAGSSAVVMRVTITEKETGLVIATPVFYARASAMGGTWTFGATDNIMLTRIAGNFTDYLKNNYPAAVGGPTGVDKK